MDQYFDGLTKALVSTQLTRRQAVARMGAGLGAAVVGMLSGGKAFAAARQCPPGKQFPCGTSCCPNGSTCCQVEGQTFCCQSRLLGATCPVSVLDAVNIGCLGV